MRCIYLDKWITGYGVQKIRHLFLLFEMAGNDPNEAKTVHEGGQRLLDDGESLRWGEVPELALKGGEKLDVVLGFGVEPVEVLHVVLELVDGRVVFLKENAENLFDLWDNGTGELLVQGGDHGVAGPPVLDLR